MTPDEFLDYMDAGALKVLEPTFEERRVRLSIVPRRETRDLVLDVVVNNTTARSFWISDLIYGRLRIYLSTATRDVGIPYGAPPFMKVLRKRDRIKIPPGHSVHREFIVKDYYSKPRIYKFVSVSLWETQLGDEETLSSPLVPLPPHSPKN